VSCLHNKWGYPLSNPACALLTWFGYLRHPTPTQPHQRSQNGARRDLVCAMLGLTQSHYVGAAYSVLLPDISLTVLITFS